MFGGIFQEGDRRLLPPPPTGAHGCKVIKNMSIKKSMYDINWYYFLSYIFDNSENFTA